MTIQSIIIPKSKFSLNQANKWIKDHNYKLKYKNKGVDITGNTYRYRQQSPSSYENYYVKSLPNKVMLLIGQNKN